MAIPSHSANGRLDDAQSIQSAKGAVATAKRIMLRATGTLSPAIAKARSAESDKAGLRSVSVSTKDDFLPTAEVWGANYGSSNIISVDPLDLDGNVLPDGTDWLAHLEAGSVCRGAVIRMLCDKHISDSDIELRFATYDYVLTDPTGKTKVVACTADTDHLKHHLSAFGGTGVLDDGTKVSRVLRGIQLACASVAVSPPPASSLAHAIAAFVGSDPPPLATKSPGAGNLAADAATPSPGLAADIFRFFS